MRIWSLPPSACPEATPIPTCSNMAESKTSKTVIEDDYYRTEIQDFNTGRDRERGEYVTPDVHNTNTKMVRKEDNSIVKMVTRRCDHRNNIVTETVSVPDEDTRLHKFINFGAPENSGEKVTTKLTGKENGEIVDKVIIENYNTGEKVEFDKVNGTITENGEAYKLDNGCLLDENGLPKKQIPFRQ